MPGSSPKAVDNLKVFVGFWRDSKNRDIVVHDHHGNRHHGRKKDELFVDVTVPQRQYKPHQKNSFELTIKDCGGVGDFVCGSYVLDFTRSHSEYLVWVGKQGGKFDGDISIWEPRSPTNVATPPIAGPRPPIERTTPLALDCHGSFEFMLHRLADVCEQSRPVKEKLMETAPHNKLHQFILDVAEGRHEQTAWDSLGSSVQQDLLKVVRLDQTSDAIAHVSRLIRADDEETASITFSKLMPQLESRIMAIVGKQTTVGNFIVEKAQLSPLHRFFKATVSGDRKSSHASWLRLGDKVREDIQKCIAMGDSPESNESLVRIIDPDGVIPFEAFTPSAPSGYHKRWQDASSWKASHSAQQPGRHDSNSNESWQGANHLETVSRRLSLVLRHDTKIAVRSDGFCRLQDVLELRRFKDIGCTIEDISQVVDGAHESGNSKQRFQVRKEGDELWIRANQGYSRKDILAECAYTRLRLVDTSLPDPCVHGTYHWHWDSILKHGLLAGGLAGRQGRNEIHFASEEPGGSRRAISGMRHDCDIAIWINLRLALEEGLPFYISDNNVILSPGDANGAIPSRFFLKVVDLRLKPPRQLWPTH